MADVRSICKFANDVIDVYEGTKSSEIRNDLYHFVVVPTLEIIYDKASHWEIDGVEKDLILDDNPGTMSEPDTFGDSIPPEVALEYIKAQRMHYMISERFEYVVNHPAVEEEVDKSDIAWELKQHINMMKDKLDAASDLLDISYRTKVPELEQIRSNLSAIVRNIYENIVPKTDAEPEQSVDEAPSEQDLEPVDDGFVALDETANDEEEIIELKPEEMGMSEPESNDPEFVPEPESNDPEFVPGPEKAEEDSDEPTC